MSTPWRDIFHEACEIKKAQQESGFSIIEVVVTVSLITVLVSLALPALSRSRALAQQQVCASHVQQIGVMASCYAGEYRSYLMPASLYQVWDGDGSGEDSSGLGWTEVLRESGATARREIYFCPSFIDRERFTYFLSARWVVVNKRSSWNREQVSFPDRLLLAAECTRRASYPPSFGTSSHVADDCDKDDGRAKSLLMPSDAGGMWFHPGGNNVLLFDGHVIAQTSHDRSRVTYHPRELSLWEDVKGPMN